MKLDMKLDMIFSITMLILIVFFFFWALQCHKEAEYEYYENINIKRNQR